MPKQNQNRERTNHKNNITNMKKQLLTLSMCLAGIGGLHAQTTENYYREGIVTDLNQLKSGDLVLLQDMDSQRSGYFDLDQESLTLSTSNSYYKDFNFIDKAFNAGNVFKVIIDGDQYKFQNLETGSYLLNNTGTGAAMQVTTEDANNTFTIAPMDGKANQWEITSVNNGFGVNAEQGYPVLYDQGGHPIYIHRVTTEQQETPWYYLAVYGITTVNETRKGNCIENAADMAAGIYAGNKIVINNTNQIWRLEENPAEANSYAIVSYTHEGNASIGQVSTPGAAGARYAFNSSEKVYQFQIQKGPSVEGYSTFNIQRPGAGAWYINAAGGGQGFYLNEWNAPNAKDYMAGAWSAVIATELKQAGDFALGTFSAPYNVTLPEGVTAYIATSSTNNAVNLEELEGTTLPANTPVVLKADAAGFYPMKQTTDAAEAITKANLLEGTGAVRTLSPVNGAFVLGQSNGKAGFYNYTAPAMGAFKAYLPKTTSDGEQIRVKSIQFPDGETTAINDIENIVEDKNAPIYNLSGQRVTNPTKGVYIQNGKKFIVK